MMSHQAFLSWLQLRFSTTDYEHHSKLLRVLGDFLARLEFKSLVTSFYCQPLIKHFKRVDRANSNSLSRVYLWTVIVSMSTVVAFHCRSRRFVFSANPEHIFSLCIFESVLTSIYIFLALIDNGVTVTRLTDVCRTTGEILHQPPLLLRFSISSGVVCWLVFQFARRFFLFLIQSTLRFRSEWFGLFSNSIVPRQLINLTNSWSKFPKKKFIENSYKTQLIA